MADAVLIEEYVKTLSNPGTAFTANYLLNKFDREVGLAQPAADDGAWSLIDEWLPRNGRAPGTQNTYLSTLHGFYEWGDAQGIFDRVPTSRVHRRDQPNVDDQVTGILDSDMSEALKWADADIRAFLSLARYAGCTPQEMSGLSRGDLTIEDGQGWLTIPRSKNNSRRVPVSAEVVEALNAITPIKSGKLWDLSAGKVGRAANDYLADIGVGPRLRNLRHQYGFDVWAESRNIEVVQERMGFKSPARAVLYKEDWRERLRAASEEETTFRLSLWEDLKQQGAEIELETINGLISAEQPAELPPLVVTATAPVADLIDNELVVSASPEQLSGLTQASDSQVPVLVAAPTIDATHVDIRLGWVNRVAQGAGVALVVLSEQAPEPLDSESEEEGAISSSRAERFEKRKARPGQERFKFRVLERYGAQCAVCTVSHPAVLEAAHIRPWIDRGSDHPGNGLVLCPLHHRAFDVGLWAIEPDTLAVLPREAGPKLGELLVTRESLEHLNERPMAEALGYAWERRWMVGRREGHLFS